MMHKHTKQEDTSARAHWDAVRSPVHRVLFKPMAPLDVVNACRRATQWDNVQRKRLHFADAGAPFGFLSLGPDHAHVESLRCEDIHSVFFTWTESERDADDNGGFLRVLVDVRGLYVLRFDVERVLARVGPDMRAEPLDVTRLMEEWTTDEDWRHAWCHVPRVSTKRMGAPRFLLRFRNQHHPQDDTTTPLTVEVHCVIAMPCMDFEVAPDDAEDY